MYLSMSGELAHQCWKIAVRSLHGQYHKKHFSQRITVKTLSLVSYHLCFKPDFLISYSAERVSVAVNLKVTCIVFSGFVI